MQSDTTAKVYNVIAIEHNGQKALITEADTKGYFHVKIGKFTYMNVTEEEARTLLKAAGIE